MKRLVDTVDRFFFAPGSPYPLIALRMALSGVLLVQAILIAPWVLDLYGQNALLQDQLNSYILAPLLPAYLDWTHLASYLHLSLDQLMQGLFAAYVISLACLFAGFKTRAAAIGAWLGHFLLMMNQGFKSSYGVDTFSHIFLFYLMIFPADRSSWSRFGLRVMQLHLAMAYCTSGITKFMGPQWHDGESIWRAMMMPQFAVFDVSWLARHAWLALAFAWGTLFLEIFYPLLLGWRRTRVAGALGILSMHAGIAIFMGLWSFALVMMSLTASLYLVPEIVRARAPEAPLV